MRALKAGGKSAGKVALASRSPPPFTLANSPVLRSFPAREQPSRVSTQEHPGGALLQPMSCAAEILPVAAGLPQLPGGTGASESRPQRARLCLGDAGAPPALLRKEAKAT